MKKKILSALLAVCLLIGCLPLGAAAEAAGAPDLENSFAQRKSDFLEQCELRANDAPVQNAARTNDAASILISYIQKNGEFDSDGDQYVDCYLSAGEGHQSVARFYYISELDSMIFDTLHSIHMDGMEVEVGAAFGYDVQTKSASEKSIFVYVGEEEYESTDFDIHSYSEDTQLRFTPSEGSTEVSGVQEMCNSVVNLAVLTWEWALEEMNLGITIIDLGFTNYIKNNDPKPSGFVDVKPSDYFYDAVNWAVEQKITAGTDATHFSPDHSCTRAQAVTFLWRAAGEPEPENTAVTFTDVAPGAYYAKAVSWAVEQGITAGTSATKFSPEAVCTRAQVVSFLYRSANSPEVSGEGSFSDVASGAYYENAVRWAVANGITAGTGQNRFSPDARCVRGQVVSFLYRYYA